MSVEESRRDVRGDVAQHIEDELWDSGTWLEQRLDRLILETSIEALIGIPCSHSCKPWDDEMAAFPGEWEEWCPTHQKLNTFLRARAELQKVAEAV